MLAVQDFLRSGCALADLRDQFGIRVYEHPTLPLVGFKYNQVDSPKLDPIVRDCRGTVLERDTWNVVAKPFRRFYNAGEDGETYQYFDWSNFTATTKHDGSLIILYFYRGEWHANTSGSFGLDVCNDSGKTWRELFWETSRIDPTRLDPELTYIFELWTPANKVIRTYPEPVAYLLSIFHNPTLLEKEISFSDNAASKLGVPRPEHHTFDSMIAIQEFLREIETRDKTFEGVVVRGDTRWPTGKVESDTRYKVKSRTYLALHHLFDNGNLFNPKRLVPLVLAGETDEVISVFPQAEPGLRTVTADLDREFELLQAVWQQTCRIESQRDFAQAIVPKTRFSSLLFELRKQQGQSQDVSALQRLWRDSEALIVKAIYKNKESIA